jgi:hypothetical protein
LPADTSRIRRKVLLAMFILACVAFFIHMKAHPPVQDLGDGKKSAVFSNVAASVLCLVDLILVTALFLRRKTAVYGYVLNGMLVVFGTVFMTHFGWAMLPEGSPWWAYAAHPTLPDVAIAWVDFFLGAALFNLWQKE